MTERAHETMGVQVMCHDRAADVPVSIRATMVQGFRFRYRVRTSRPVAWRRVDLGDTTHSRISRRSRASGAVEIYNCRP
jgi:hypothetical protein